MNLIEVYPFIIRTLLNASKVNLNFQKNKTCTIQFVHFIKVLIIVTLSCYKTKLKLAARFNKMQNFKFFVSF